jgi:hypothetical protein
VSDLIVGHTFRWNRQNKEKFSLSKIINSFHPSERAVSKTQLILLPQATSLKARINNIIRSRISSGFYSLAELRKGYLSDLKGTEKHILICQCIGGFL